MVVQKTNEERIGILETRYEYIQAALDEIRAKLDNQGGNGGVTIMIGRKTLAAAIGLPTTGGGAGGVWAILKTLSGG